MRCWPLSNSSRSKWIGPCHEPWAPCTVSLNGAKAESRVMLVLNPAEVAMSHQRPTLATDKQSRMPMLQRAAICHLERWPGAGGAVEEEGEGVSLIPIR